MALGLWAAKRPPDWTLAAAEGTGEPLKILPRSPEKSAISLAAGEVLLFEYLQGLADSSARSVYVVDLPTQTKKVRVKRALTSIETKDAIRLLDQHGVYLSEDTYRGKKIFWVQPKLERSRRRGGLIRRPRNGENRDEGHADESADSARDSRRPGVDADDGPSVESANPNVRVYRRGEGRQQVWMVQFETEDRERAWEVVSLIEALTGERRPAERR